MKSVPTRTCVKNTCLTLAVPFAEAVKMLASHSVLRTKVYRVWLGVRQRCRNPKCPSYQVYGARGVDVCDDWYNSFDCFLRDMGDPPEGYTLDRIDNGKGYCKENCRWASPKTQANNRRNNIIVTIDGVSHTATEWASINGLNAGTVRERIRRGWPPEEAVTCPKQRSRFDHARYRDKLCSNVH